MWVSVKTEAETALSPQEIAALQKLGAHRKLSAQQINEVVREASIAKTNIPTPENQSQANEHLQQLVHAVLADGQISRQETKLISNYAQNVGLSNADVQMAIAKVRKHSYQQARAELRRR